MTTAEAVLTVATGAVVGVFGVLIRYYQMTGLIAGYDSEAVTDDEGLASFVGTYVLLTGVMTVAIGVAIFLELVGSSTTLWVAYSFAVVLVTVRVVIGAQQYAES
jgi:hypothetical protein